jgi:hypothetical protein
MVDLFFPDAEKPDGFRRVGFTIVAYDHVEAIREAKNAALPRKPAHFHVRAVSHIGDSVIYRSEDG